MQSRDPPRPEPAQRTLRSLDLRPGSAWESSIHMLPPPLRAQLRGSLSPGERRLLSLVACDCSTLSDAARELGLAPDEADRLWRATAARILRTAREAGLV